MIPPLQLKPNSYFVSNGGASSLFDRGLVQGPTSSTNGISPFTAFFVVKLAPFVDNSGAYSNVKLTTAANYPSIFTLDDLSSTMDLKLQVKQAPGGKGWIQYRLVWGPGSTQFVDTAASYVQEDTHIVVLVQEKDRTFLYVDGTSFVEGMVNPATAKLSAPVSPAITNPVVYLGRGNAEETHEFNGQISEVIIYECVFNFFSSKPVFIHRF